MKNKGKILLLACLIIYLSTAAVSHLVPPALQRQLQGHKTEQVLLEDSSGGAYRAVMRQGDILVFEEYQPRTWLWLITVERLIWKAEYDLSNRMVITATEACWSKSEEETPALFYARRYAQTLDQGDCIFVFGVSEGEYSPPVVDRWDDQVKPVGDEWCLFSYYTR